MDVHDEGAKAVRFDKKYEAQINTEEKEDQNKTNRLPEPQIESEFIAMGSNFINTKTIYACTYGKHTATIMWNTRQETDHIPDGSYF